MSLVALLRREPRALGFGLLHTVAATVGQTFVVSLFLPGIKAAHGLGDAEVALLFTATTLASAAALWKIGAWIDRADVVPYSLGSGVLLALGCGLMALAPTLTVLVVALFCVRLAGNGLLTHVAVTATARYFSHDRGRALALVLLGSSVGEAGLPAVLVASIGVAGWQWTLVMAGGFALVLVVAACRGVRGLAGFRRLHAGAMRVDAAPAAPRAVTRGGDTRRYFAWTAPLFVAMPMVITATVFHQALLAREQGVPLEWFAISFVAFALVRMPVSIITGRLADRIGSAWLFCLHLLPLAAGIAALDLAREPWVAPFYWLCAGVTSGMGTVLQTTVVAQRVALARLGSARSLVGAIGIVASAIGPSLFGLALAAGAGMSAVLWGCVAVLAAATALGVAATRRESAGPPATRGV